MAVDRTNSTPTTLPPLPVPGGASTSNPVGTTAEDALQVQGVGALLGLSWGAVTVAVAVGAFNKLAKEANSHTTGALQAQARLIQIQEEMKVAGAYGAKGPRLGSITAGLDDIAFRKILVGAAQSGQKVGDFLTGNAQQAQQTGTAGSGTHIIPARIIPEKVWAPIDILAAVNAATTANGENLAQKLIGRNFTQEEMQSIANQMNVAQQGITSADVAGALQQQQEQVATSQAINGQPASTVDIGGAGKVTAPQIYAEIIRQGGTPLQAQVGAAIGAGGFEANGTLNDQNPTSTASGLFQFLDTTWQNFGGVSHAGNATFQQQVSAFIQHTGGKGGSDFSAWAPDMGGSYNGKGWKGAPAPGSKVANAIPTLGLNQLAVATPTTGQKPNNPAPTLKQGRTDQGVDYSGAGNLYPTGAGTIMKVQTSGWGSLGNAGQGALIAVRLDHPPDPQHSVVYYAEHIVPNVQEGQHVVPGQVIGKATGKGGGIEIGFADPSNPSNPLAPLNMKATGATTTEGDNFASWVKSGTISAVAAGGANGQTTDVYQNPIVNPVPSQTGLNAQDYATAFAEQQDSPDFQKNNLLRVFSQVESSLKSPPTPNAHVLSGPVSMK